MKWFLHVSFVAVVVSVCATRAQIFGYGNRQTRIPATIFYSALCPDSKKFVLDQLAPAYEEISHFIELKLVPFGKAASVDGGRSFECQRGPAECLGNRMHSCAFHFSTSTLQMVTYLLCEMQEEHGSKGSLECAARIGLPQNEIAQCVMSEMGTNLQLIAEQDTAPLRLDFIPSIQLGTHFDKGYQEYARSYFKQFICQAIIGSDCPRSTLL